MTAIKGACLSLVFSKSCGPDGGGGQGMGGGFGPEQEEQAVSGLHVALYIHRHVQL